MNAANPVPSLRPFRAALLVLGGALLLALTPSAALANGGEKKDIEAGVFPGSLSPDNYDSLDPDNGLFWGIRGGYWFTPKWSVEGTYQRLSTDVSGPGSPSADLSSLRANGLWNFRAQKKF